MTSPAAEIARLERRRALIGEIIAGLDGTRRFSWGSGEFSSKRRLLQELGIHLVTKTGIKERRCRLKRGARPVGSVYFDAPISRHSDVYVLHVQATKNA